MSDYPVIGGHWVSWAEASFGISIPDGEDLTVLDISSVKWTSKLEGADVFGAGPNKRGRTIGQANFEGELAMYFDAAQRLKRALAAKSQTGKRYGTIPFDLTINYSPIDGDGTIATVLLQGCRITSAGTDMSSGSADALVVTMPLSILRVEEDADGLAIY